MRKIILKKTLETFVVFKVSVYLCLEFSNQEFMKETIFKKTLELFTKHGFKAITMDDIAKELGISKKTIYQHFSSKNKLVEESVLYVYDTAMERLLLLQEKAATPIHEHFEMKNCIPDMFGLNIQAATIFQFHKYYPKIAEKIKRKRENDFEITILRNINKGVELGYYRKEIDIEFVGQMLFVNSTSLFNDEHFVNAVNSKSFDELETKIAEYHLRSIVTPKGLEILETLLKTHNYA